MCGIVGVARFGELGDKNLRASALYMASSLLEVTENRGKDATGIAALFDDGKFFGQKMGVSATEFIARFGGEDKDFDGLLSVLRDYTAGLRMIIGHCRKKSVGGVDNVDNHPIKTGNIIGLHNGTLKNHDEIFSKLNCPRDGKVDSEAIFRLLQHFTKDCKEPFTVEMLEEVTKRLEGSFSILAFNANNPNQLVSARDARPAEYCLIKPLKLVLIASEKKFMEQVIWSYNKLSYLHGVNSFVKLKSTDVEFKSLSDDTIALFDLTKEITAETKLTDLYKTHDIPKSLDRIWKVPVTTTSYAGHSSSVGYNRVNGNANKFSSNDEKEDKKQNITGKNKITTAGIKAIGSVWNNSLNKYVKAFGNKKSVEEGKILDTEKKVKMSIDDAIYENELDSVDLPETTKIHEKTFVKKNDSVEGFLPKKFTAIKEIAGIKPVSNTSTLVRLKDAVKKSAEKNSSTLRVTQDAKEAIENIKTFKDVYEVAEACDTTIRSLNKLPITAFANRILKSMFSKIFINGWEVGNKRSHNDEELKKKLKRAQKHIRVLKELNAQFNCIMNESIKPSTTKNWFKTFAKHTNMSGELNTKTLNDLFNAGDFRDNKTLRSALLAFQETGD